jgi:hypothetical protein
MRKASIGIALLLLTGCDSNPPQPPAATDKSLGAAIEEVARPSDPVAVATDGAQPEATDGGAAVQ